MGTVYLVRHGQASFGERDYDQLSPLGMEQSRALGSWIRQCGLKVDRVVVGGNRRHWQTAQCCLASIPGAPPEPEWCMISGFSEFDHLEVVERLRPDLRGPEKIGSWLAGMADPRREFQKVFAPAFERWVNGEHDDYAESYAAFRERCWKAISGVMENGLASLTTWVFTSGGPISAIVQNALAIPNERLPQLTWTLVNTGVTKLVCRADGVNAATINQYPHLEQMNKPEWITYR